MTNELDDNQKECLRDYCTEFRNSIRRIIQDQENNLIPTDIIKKELTKVFCVCMFADFDPKESHDYFKKLSNIADLLVEGHRIYQEADLWLKIPEQFEQW
jgi:hypothetical protein